MCIQCEEPLSHSKYILNHNLQTIIEKHLLQVGEKQYQTYMKTKKMRDSLREKRYIKIFTEGLKIDIRDKYFDWYEADVQKIINKDNVQHIIVKIQNSTLKTEVINCKSPRIAPLGYFTKRKDLKSREEKKLDIVKSLVNQYEEQRIQRNQSQEQPQNENQIPGQENFHNLIYRHLTSAQSLPFMISLMNGAMRRSEQQQRIINTIQLTSSNAQGNQAQQQQHQPQEQENNIQVEQNQPINNEASQQGEQEENRQQSNQNENIQNEENQNQEEQTEITIEEYENENEDDEDVDDQDILSNSEYSYQNIDTFQYVQEWE